MSRILITGGAGFVGSCLARRLNDVHDVSVIARTSVNLWRLNDFIRSEQLNFGDIRDKEFVHTLMQNVKPDIVCHLATHGVQFNQKDIGEILGANVVGFVNLVTESQNCGLRLFINTGSSSEYGIKTFPMKESDSLEPISIYGLSKSVVSKLAEGLHRIAGVSIVNVRLFSPYGPYDSPGWLIPNLLACCLTGKDPDLASPDIARDFVFIDDVVNVYEKLISDYNLEGVAGETFNVGSGIQTNLDELVKAAISVSGASINPKWNVYPRRPWDTSTWVADISKATKYLDWYPQFSLRDGLAETIKWMRQDNNLAQYSK